MPTTYAHHRFGAEMLRLMPADVRGTAKRHRHLYDTGLQGPDLLFFYRPVFPGKIHRLGRKFHMQTGREFFSRVCRNLRLEPSEGGQAYLYGVLCHFALDAGCRPLVTQVEGAVNQMGVERSFDRFLMERDGCCLTGALCLPEPLVLTDRECGILSRFYPGTDKAVIRESLWSMRKIHRILEMEPGPARTMLVKALEFGLGDVRDRIAGQIPDAAWSHWNQPLLERYRQAAEAFPDMLLKLIAHLTYNAPLGESFDPIFG